MAHRPIGLEGMDDRLIEDMKNAGLHRTGRHAAARGQRLAARRVRRSGPRRSDAAARGAHAPRLGAWRQRADVEAGRRPRPRRSGSGRSASRASARPPPRPTDRPTWPGWEDSAVPPERVGEYLRALRHLLERSAIACDLYGHFGQGCMHTRIDFDLSRADGHRALSRVRRSGRRSRRADGRLALGRTRRRAVARRAAAEDVRPRSDGGVSRVQGHLGSRRTDEPGKVVEPAGLDEHLRSAPHHPPQASDTHFQFPDDARQLRARHAALRRRRQVPPARWRHDVPELHGDARGAALDPRPRAIAVRDARRRSADAAAGRANPSRRRSICASPARAARATAPSSVDMATYKAEFLSHYYEAHRRPIRRLRIRPDSVLGAPGVAMPRLVNFAATRRRDFGRW